MNQSSSGIGRVVVVVPVHNEEALLEDCLSSLCSAVDNAAAHHNAGVRVSIDTQVIVVLDACVDASAEIALARAAEGLCTIIEIDERCVGAARAQGFLAAGGSPADVGNSARGDDYGASTWFATTDADSAVRPDWLSSQLVHARRGARVVAGTVLVDLDTSGDAGAAATAAIYHSGYRHRPGHGHIHGANLGIRSDVYWSVGGFDAVESDEDVGLIHRLEQAAIPVMYACDSPVTTSPRRIGRAPDGFAGHLRSIELAVTP